jgi:glycosyltransferase involved in cell wall biosynthesis
MKIDVVIPVRNGQEFILRAIQSVIKQKYLGKVFVIDDGSSDGTAELVKQANFGSNVVVITRQPKGLSNARNSGVSHCTSEWIAFLDADDYWGEGKLESHFDHIQAHPDCVFSFTGAIDFSEDGKIIGPQQLNNNASGDFLSVISQDFKVTGSASSVLINSKLLELVNGFDENLPYGEDWDLWIRISRFHSLCQLQKYLTYICIRSDSMQRQKRPGIEKFLNSKIHFYEADKYRDLVPEKTMVNLICNSVWADFRRYPLSFVFSLRTYRIHLESTFPNLSKVIPLHSNLAFVKRVIAVKLIFIFARSRRKVISQ